ncbi:hypothetical protein NL676_034812 [Syzygium grande]|nr:hypothetical protein NL676_034812 [Syzygium grande]
MILPHALLDTVNLDDGIVKKQQSKKEKDGGGRGREAPVDDEEVWSSGWPVLRAYVSSIKAVMKRQPRQYMNSRGGFNWS